MQLTEQEVENRCSGGTGVTAARRPSTGQRRNLALANLDWAAGIARAVHAHVPDVFELRDLTQTAHLELWRAVEAYQPARGVPFRAYAYPRVRGAVLMQVRRRHWLEATCCDPIGEEAPADHWATPAESERLDQERAFKAAAAAIADLPPLQRYIVQSYYLHGRRVDKIARQMHISLSRAYRLRSQALAILRRQLRGRGIEGIGVTWNT